jgi:opine dehydrogenase
MHDAAHSLKHRYITEDLMYGLVPTSYLAEVAGLKTPVFNSIISVAGVAKEVDYWSEGVSLEKLSLNDMGS